MFKDARHLFLFRGTLIKSTPSHTVSFKINFNIIYPSARSLPYDLLHSIFIVPHSLMIVMLHMPMIFCKRSNCFGVIHTLQYMCSPTRYTVWS